jgi:hypothetical protein
MALTRNCVMVLGVALLALAGCSDDDDTKVDAGPKSNGVCLRVADIDHTEIINDGAILFHMKVGKPYLNTLRYPCPSLVMEEGFAYETPVPEICSESQTIRVLRSGNFCELGQFTPFDAPIPPKAPTP